MGLRPNLLQVCLLVLLARNLGKLLSELRTEDGELPSANGFNGGKKGNVFVGTTFGITGGMLRNRDLTQH